MEQTITDIKTRHRQAHSELRKVVNPIIDQRGVRNSADIVAKRLIISRQTVINYINGRCKDGFLTEAIMHEFKNL